MKDEAVQKSVKKFKIQLPTTLVIRRETVMKALVGVVIALVLVPVFDWVIQTSITSQYVAFYKNADVSRAAYVKEMERQYGDQVVNEMLAKAAIAQAAKERDITVSEADIDKAVEADKTNAGITTAEDFEAALAQSGITVDEYRAYVKVTVTLDKLIEGTITDPTDAEIEEYFTSNKTLFEGKKLEEVKTTIAAEIKQNKLSETRQEWISKALENFNASNTLVSKESRKYKFLRSIDLVTRLFSADPTK